MRVDQAPVTMISGDRHSRSFAKVRGTLGPTVLLSKMGEWIAHGLIIPQVTVWNGFVALPNALAGLFKGQNSGKLIVKRG
jgi:NADPH-dependent curcumin reductase CurA